MDKYLAVKIRYIGYALTVFAAFLLIGLNAASLQAAPDTCVTNSLGDRICDTPGAKKASKPGTKKTSTAKGTGLVNSDGSPILGSEAESDSEKELFEKLKEKLDKLPDVIEYALIDESLNYFTDNTDPKKRKDLLTKLDALTKRTDALVNNACGLSGSPTAGDYRTYILSSIATSVQYSNITALSSAQMNQYLAALEKEICAGIKEQDQDLYANTGDETQGYVDQGGYVDSGYGSDDGDGPASYPGGGSFPGGGSDYGPSVPSDYSEALPGDIQGVGGDAIAECAQKMIGHSTRRADTGNGNLGCALAVSNILKCAKASVGEHISTVTLYQALEKDKCFKMVGRGHLDNIPLQPGDVLVTKRGRIAGHTGIFIGGDKIISNSSGSGSIRQNYNTGSWKNVTNRNPGGSAVFRRVCE